MSDIILINGKKIIVTDQDIDDVMTTALDGGITDWCFKTEVLGESLGEYASEQISRGGLLKLYGIEEVNGESKWWLNRNKFMAGLTRFLREYGEKHEDFFLREDDGSYTLDSANIDADFADLIIQYAVFGEYTLG